MYEKFRWQCSSQANNLLKRENGKVTLFLLFDLSSKLIHSNEVTMFTVQSIFHK